MPDLKEVRASHPAMSFVTVDTVANPHSRHVLYPKALCPIKRKCYRCIDFKLKIDLIMKISDFAIENLKAIIIGEQGNTPYLSDPKLVDLFNTYGERDIYDHLNGGFPKVDSTTPNLSRKEFAKFKIKKLNDTKNLKLLIERVVKSSDLPEKAAESVNKVISSEGFVLEKVGNLYYIKGTPNYVEPQIPEIHFEDIQKKILEEISLAKYLIWIAVAWFTDKVLFDKLIEKRNAGLNIRIVVIDDEINKNCGLDFESNFEIKRVAKTRFDNIMHNKFCIIDLNTVINGSYNWTKKAQYNQENITIDKNIKTAETFADKFIELKKIN
jgi:hypothetical protein